MKSWKDQGILFSSGCRRVNTSGQSEEQCKINFEKYKITYNGYYNPYENREDKKNSK